MQMATSITTTYVRIETADLVTLQEKTFPACQCYKNNLGWSRQSKSFTVYWSYWLAVFENVERCEVDLKFNSVCTKKHEKWHKKILWKIDFARDHPILWLKIGTLDNKSLQERPRLEKKTLTTSIVAIYWFSSDPCPINMLCFIDDLLIHSKVHLLCKKCIVHRKLWLVCTGHWLTQ